MNVPGVQDVWFQRAHCCSYFPPPTKRRMTRNPWFLCNDIVLKEGQPRRRWNTGGNGGHGFTEPSMHWHLPLPSISPSWPCSQIGRYHLPQSCSSLDVHGSPPCG